MAKRIYKHGNYLIKDDGLGQILDYDSNDSFMTERSGSFMVKDKVNNVSFDIAYSDAGEWFLEDGLEAYTEETLRDFFRTSTGGAADFMIVLAV
jgi:hypothetical protein